MIAFIAGGVLGCVGTLAGLYVAARRVYRDALGR